MYLEVYMSNPYFTYCDENGVKRSTLRVEQDIISEAIPKELQGEEGIYFDILLGPGNESDTHAVAVAPQTIDKIKKLGISPIDLFGTVANMVRSKVLNGDIEGMKIQTGENTWSQISDVFYPEMTNTNSNNSNIGVKF